MDRVKMVIGKLPLWKMRGCSLGILYITFFFLYITVFLCLECDGDQGVKGN